LQDISSIQAAPSSQDQAVKRSVAGVTSSGPSLRTLPTAAPTKAIAGWRIKAISLDRLPRGPTLFPVLRHRN